MFLQLTNVSIGYPSKKEPKIVQKGLNLSADKGELIALIGKNGCGKSTLLRSIACLQPIFSGNITIDGENISEISPKQRAQLISIVLTDQRFGQRDTAARARGTDPDDGLDLRVVV